MLKPLPRLLMSIALGLFLALGAGLYLRRRQNKAQAQARLTPVWRAKQFIAPGQALTPEMMAVQSVPEAYVEPRALGPATVIKGEKGPLFQTRVGILKGEQITRSKLIDRSLELGLAWAIPPTERALSLRLLPDQAVAGFLRPGDWVDIFCTLDRQPGWEEPRTIQVCSRVYVLAVDEKDATSPGPRSSTGLSDSERATLVTLAVAPEQSGLLAFAAEKGRLRLALMSAVDDEAHLVAPITFARLHK